MANHSLVLKETVRNYPPISLLKTSLRDGAHYFSCCYWPMKLSWSLLTWKKKMEKCSPIMCPWGELEYLWNLNGYNLTVTRTCIVFFFSYIDISTFPFLTPFTTKFFIITLLLKKKIYLLFQCLLLCIPHILINCSINCVLSFWIL